MSIVSLKWCSIPPAQKILSRPACEINWETVLAWLLGRMELWGWCLLVLKSTRMILKVVCKYIVDGRGVRIPDQTRSAKRQRDTATWHSGFHHRIVHIHLTWKRPLQNNLVSAKGKYRNLLSWLIRNYGVQWKELLVVSAVPNQLPSTMNPNHYWFHCEKCRCRRHPQSKNIENTDGFCLLACRERGKATHLIPAYLQYEYHLTSA